MKKWLLLLLVLTSCGKQPPKPGPTDLELNNLQGKVKSVKECYIYQGKEDCSTVEYTPEGWRVDFLKTGVLKVVGEFKVYEYSYEKYRYVEKFKDGNMINKTIYETKNGLESLSSESSITFNEKNQKILEKFHHNFDDRTGEYITEYIYTSNGELDRKIDYPKEKTYAVTTFFSTNGLEIKNIFDYGDSEEPSVEEYTYEFDENKNWVKQYTNKQLVFVRTISYY